MKARAPLSALRRWVLAMPALWLFVFFLAPFALVLKIAMSKPAIAQPPYTPIFSLADGWAALLDKVGALSFDTFDLVIGDDLYLSAYLSSLRLAGFATLLTLLIAFPLAYSMTRAPKSWRIPLVMLAIAPFWTSFLIRIYAWIMLLKDEGLINKCLLSLGLISAPLQIFATETAVLIGIVYSYLPFMILPLYTALDKQDPALVEAASDLGATPLTCFWRITVPLARSGMFAGILLVFIPAVGEFVIPDLLGGSDMLMIGRSLWSEFFDNRDWPTASAVAVLLLILLIAPLMIYERQQMKEAAR